MTERLLQFIWRYGYFNPHELRLESGEHLQILSPGDINLHQGPDFLWGSFRIGETVWVGNIELHLSASGWQKHSHGKDKQYDNVILHVVWENDLPPGHTHLPGERDIPLLVLQHRVPKYLLGKYEEWMANSSFVPCERQLQDTLLYLWPDWKQQLLLERLQCKTLFIRNCLLQNRENWEETSWWLLARNFGNSVNAEAFGAIAQSLPLSILMRHRDRLEELEALLLGQAGLLNQEFKTDYPLSLQKNYFFLRNKYGLRPIHQPVHFLRMRPSNFPTIRLAQLAAVLQKAFPLFTRLKETASPWDLDGCFSVAASSFWDHHYTLHTGDDCFVKKNLGADMRENILLNTLAPLLFAYGSLRQETPFKEKALQWLRETRAERNGVIVGWKGLNVPISNAADSQALLELKSNYCDVRKCLDCAVGKALLGKTGALKGQE